MARVLAVAVFLVAAVVLADVAIVIESKVTWDAGVKYYSIPYAMSDGGRSFNIAPSNPAPCKRRPAGVLSALCLRLGSIPVPDYNRYPSDQFIDLGCEGVACSVFSGMNPNDPEVAP